MSIVRDEILRSLSLNQDSSQGFRFSPLMRWTDNARDIRYLEPSKKELSNLRAVLPTYFDGPAWKSSPESIDPYKLLEDFYQSEKFQAELAKTNELLKDLSKEEISNLVQYADLNILRDKSSSELKSFAQEMVQARQLASPKVRESFRRDLTLLRSPSLAAARNPISFLIFKQADGMKSGVAAYKKVLAQHPEKFGEEYLQKSRVQERYEIMFSVSQDFEKSWFESLPKEKQDEIKAQGSAVREKLFNKTHPEYSLALLYLSSKADLQEYIYEDEQDLDLHTPLHREPDHFLDADEMYWLLRRQQPRATFLGKYTVDRLENLEKQIWYRLDEKQKEAVTKKEQVISMLNSFNLGLTDFENYDAQNASLLKLKTIRNIASIPDYMICTAQEDDKIQYDVCRLRWGGDMAAEEAARDYGEERNTAIEALSAVLVDAINQKEDWVFQDDFVMTAVSKLNEEDQATLKDYLAVEDLAPLALMKTDRKKTVEENAVNLKIAQELGQDFKELSHLSERDFRDLYMLHLARKSLSGDLGGVELHWNNRSFTRWGAGTPNLLWSRIILAKLSDPEETDSEYVRNEAAALLRDSKAGSNSLIDAVAQFKTSDEFEWGLEGDFTRFAMTFLGFMGGGYLYKSKWTQRVLQPKERMGRMLRYGAGKVMLTADALDEFNAAFAWFPLYSVQNITLRAIHNQKNLHKAVKATRAGGADGFKLWAEKNPKKYFSLSPRLRKSFAKGEVPDETNALLKKLKSKNKLSQEAWEIEWAKANPKAMEAARIISKPLIWIAHFDKGLVRLVTHPAGMGAISGLHGVQKLNPAYNSELMRQDEAKAAVKDDLAAPQDPMDSDKF